MSCNRKLQFDINNTSYASRTIHANILIKGLRVSKLIHGPSPHTNVSHQTTIQRDGDKFIPILFYNTITSFDYKQISQYPYANHRLIVAKINRFNVRILKLKSSKFKYYCWLCVGCRVLSLSLMLGGGARLGGRYANA